MPGGTTPALTRGFGAVFTDVEPADTSGIEFFDATGASLGTYYAPAASGSETLSFLGVDFGDAAVSRVRVTAGTAAPGGPEGAGTDPVVLDDFTHGEPIQAAAVPEPGSAALLAAGPVALGS